MAKFVTRRRVEFCETDLAGIVHFSNFFRYMEFAEQEFLRSRGLSVAWQQGEETFGFPRVSAQCDYLRPARFEDMLTIAVLIERIGEKSLTYSFEFSIGDDLIARGNVVCVCCRKSTKGLESVSIPPALREKLSGPASSVQ